MKNTLICLGLAIVFYSNQSLSLTKKNHIELLFFQQAASGSMHVLEKKRGCYDLELIAPPSSLLYFSNYPDKVVGNIKIKPFLNMLSHNQRVEKIIPNAVLNGDIKNKPDIKLVGTLSNAKYVNKSFHYEFCLFNGNGMEINGELNNIRLFIDPIHRWPP